MFEKYDEERVIYERKSDYDTQFVVTWKLVVAKTKTPEKRIYELEPENKNLFIFFLFSMILLWFLDGNTQNETLVFHGHLFPPN